MLSWLLAAIAFIRVFNQDGSTQDFYPTSTTVTATSSTTTTTARYRSIYGGGYSGAYDGNGPTITTWPLKPSMVVIQGEANAQGPLVQQMKAAARAAGNLDTRFLFYLSLTDMDSQCGCYDQGFYDSFKTSHPEWILKSASGAMVSTNNGLGRVWATDIGNTAYVDAWTAWAITAMLKYNWDGVWIDNVIRCNGFGEWSALPVNPRTGAAYTCSDYRLDMVNALSRIRVSLKSIGKTMIGNHSGAWHNPGAFEDHLIKQQIALMDGVRIEDCVMDYSGKPHTEAEWIQQLQYAAYANSLGVLVQCEGVSGTIGASPSRDYVLATELLTKEKLSGVAELNTVGTYWPGMDVDLGVAKGGYECLDGSGAVTASCPAVGDVYRRRWTKGVVAVNPTGATRTVSLGQATTCGTAITMPPQSGKVCLQ